MIPDKFQLKDIAGAWSFSQLPSLKLVATNSSGQSKLLSLHLELVGNVWIVLGWETKSPNIDLDFPLVVRKGFTSFAQAVSYAEEFAFKWFSEFCQ